ncbi:pyridoxamine 5'-phosphate oxidase family protein [Halosegnis sp.]|uniref:pyridoxamine 5'-phosphate oxidase family protein n=1 Tax=Halosegnis sp. TaxID=2864959 RepID=UPI0035D45DF9
MRVTGDWAETETRAFLTSDDGRVPLRLACRTPAGGLWMLSLWYQWRDGGLDCATSASADVVEYLAHNDGVAFEVSVNEPPYRGVRGAGTADVSPDEDKQLLRELLDRYLDGTDSPLAGRLLREEREEVHVRINPEKVYTWDFSDRMREQ